MLRQEQIAETYPLTPLQEGMLFHEREGTSGQAYFEQFAFTFEGELDIDLFFSSWNEVIRRHPVLRTIFAFQKAARPMQLVLKEWEAKPEILDWRSMDSHRVDSDLETLKRDDRQRPFQLNKEPPTRWTLVMLPDRKMVVLWSHHHIILDGWSGGVLLKEVLEVYQSKLLGEVQEWKAPPSFKSFVEWLEQTDSSVGLEHWDRVMATMDEIPQLPRAVERSEDGTYVLETIKFELTRAHSQALERLALECEMTLGSLTQFLWGMVAARCAGNLHTAFLTIVSGRSPTFPGIEDSVGLFINSVPVVVAAEAEDSLKAFVERSYDAWLDSEQYHHVSLSEVQGRLGRGRHFDHLFVFINYPMDKMLDAFQQKSLGFRLVKVDVFEHSNYDLEVIVHPGDRIRFDFKYNSHVYSSEIVSGLAEAMRILLEQAGSSPNPSVSDLELVSEETRLRLMNWGKVRAPKEGVPSIIRRFHSTALQFPDRMALISEEGNVSYRALWAAVTSLAEEMREKHGIGPGDRVGVCMHSGRGMVLGILAVLHAGGVYVPLDPNYPLERLRWMVEDSQMRLLILEDELQARFEVMGVRAFLIQVFPNAQGETLEESEPGIEVGDDDPAYVIYTSGSTGNPKGCVVSHGNVAKLFQHEGFQFDFNEKDVWILAHSFCFDFSVWEMYGALLFGGVLVLPPQEARRNPVQMVRLVREHGVSVLNQTPGAFLQFVQAHFDEHECLSLGALRWVIFGGDRLEPSRLKLWIRRYPLERVRLVNMYGITETTVHVTFYRLTETDVEAGLGGRSPIGLPLPHMEAYLCDPCLKLVPPGIPGEFYIGGSGVSLGYLNRPELTEHRFLHSPFRHGERVYRTGDLGIWHPDGRLEYIGRNDTQAQIRGFRVEMGEIEVRVQQLPGVREAVAMPVSVGSGEDEAIAAYLLLEDEVKRRGEFSSEFARKFLAERIPTYMVPSFFIVLDSFPLNHNGKIDRHALPDPRVAAARASTEDMPRTEEERVISKIWAEALELDQVGIRDNFFDLGGHSLVATRIASRIYKQLGVSVPIRMFFEESTVEAIAREVEHGKPLPEEPLVAVPRQDSYPLSNAQRRMWVADQVKGGEPAYNLVARYRLQGSLNVEALQKSISWVVDRHESLRTSIHQIDGEPRQVISPRGIFSLKVHERTTGEAAEVMIAQMGKAPFDLAATSLLRVSLFPLGAQEWILVFCLHHIITDGWSLSLMAYQIGVAYESFSAGHAPGLPDLKIHYKEYADWQGRVMRSGKLTRDRSYWLERFGEHPEPLDLPYDHPRPIEKSFVGQHTRFQMDKVRLVALRTLAERNGATLFMSLTAVVKVLLERLSGNQDIVVGTPIAGRDHPDLEDQLGCYLNTLALRTTISGRASFREVLRAVRTTVTDAFEHREYPFDVLVDELQLRRDTGRAPLFDVLLGLQSQAPVLFGLSGIQVNSEPVETGSSKFDITWSFEEAEDCLMVDIEINTDLWDSERAGDFFEQFQRIVSFAVEHPDADLSELSLVTDLVRRQIESEWNPGCTPFPDMTDVASMFEERVEESPEAIALWDAGTELSYLELNGRANEVAMGLRSKFEIHPGDHVGVCVSRGTEAIVVILAILKLGAVYVPIDTSFPAERAIYLARDGECRLIVSDERQMARLSEGLPFDSDIRLVPVDRLFAQLEMVFKVDARRPDNLAYIMYTSGSTGLPKGVAVTHRSVVRLVCNTNYIDLKQGDRVLQFSNIAFDGSVFDIFGPLLNGAALVLVDEESARDLVRLRDLVMKSGANISFVTTALFNQLVDFDLNLLGKFRALLFGGQEASVDHVRRARAGSSGLKELIHVYGPTETTTFATFYPVMKLSEGCPRVPIGRPISNTSAYVLDAYLNLQPPGVPGDLYIGGPGLARGYWRHEESTRAQFIEHPFLKGERLYATGDRAMWNREGQLEFLGRRDGQVKIRGYRIELSEIENVLLGYPNLLRVAVTARSNMLDGTKEIVAYVVAVDALALVVEELRTFMSRRLPDYMIPAHFVALEELPITPNGKVDTKALPDPDGVGLGGGKGGMEARNDQESTLLAITREILRRTDMGIFDNFFSMGGDSIKAIQIAARLHEMGYRLEVRDIFLHQTMEELAAVLRPVDPPVSQEAVRGVAPLGPTQKWFFDRIQDQAGGHHFNQSVRLRFRVRMKLEWIKQALEQLVIHHDALRCRFRTSDQGDVIQDYSDTTVRFRLETLRSVEEGSGCDVHCVQALQRLQGGMCPEDGMLLGALLIHGEVYDEIVISIHHLAVDTVSWRILAEDLEALLNAARMDQCVSLPEKTTSYMQWASALRETISRRQQWLTEEESFWEASIPQQIPHLFEGHLMETPGSVANDSALRQEFPEESTQGLQAHAANRPGIGMMALLLTAVSRARATLGEVSPLFCALEGHGRDLFVGESLEVNRTVGWFTHIYPISIRPDESGTESFGDGLLRIAEELALVRSKQMPFVLTQFGRSSRFPLSVNYLGEFEYSAEGGLLQRINGEVGLLVDKQLPRFHEADLVAEIVNGRLVITLSYSVVQYEPGRLNDFFRRVIDELETAAKVTSFDWGKNSSVASKFDVEFQDSELDALLDSLGSD